MSIELTRIYEVLTANSWSFHDPGAVQATIDQVCPNDYFHRALIMVKCVSLDMESALHP